MISAIGFCLLATQLAVATPAVAPNAATAVATQATATAIHSGDGKPEPRHTDHGHAVRAGCPPQHANSRSAGEPGLGMLGSEEDLSRKTLALINNARAQEGLPLLEWNDRLAEAARHHAELLAQNQQLSHQFAEEPPLQQRLAEVGVRFRSAGENIAVHYSAEGAHRAFMHSLGHRANILSPEFDEAGVAVVRDGDLLYFVEDFAKRRRVLSNAEVSRALAERFADLRHGTGAPALREIYDARVQAWACAVAQDLQAAPMGRFLPGAQFVLAFHEAEGDRLPDEVGRLTSMESFDHYALGVCFSRTPRYPNGRYFVTMALYSGTPASAPEFFAKAPEAAPEPLESSLALRAATNVLYSPGTLLSASRAGPGCAVGRQE